MFKIPNPLESFKQKYIEIGHKQGYDEGILKGYERSDSYYKLFNTAWNSVEVELNELREFKNSVQTMIENNKSSIQSTQQTQTQTPTKTEKELIEEHMFYFKSYAEVVDSSFFNNVLYQTSSSESIKDLITYIDFLENSIEVKSIYPETCKVLPKLKSAYEKLYENKLAVEEAERLF